MTAVVGGSVNVALATAGGTATASSTIGTGYPASSAINNERAGANWGGGTGGWKDATGNGWPDWLQVNFSGSKKIDRVVVYSAQDILTAEPTDTMTFALYGLRDFSVQAWNGSAWVTLGTVSRQHARQAHGDLLRLHDRPHPHQRDQCALQL